MKNYNFQILSPYEFEILSRDLLQLHLDAFLESFGEGQDDGIDLRCSKGEYIVVQAKRYKNFSSLVSNLKKEQIKVEKLKPERYILTTSCSLSPANKEIIRKLFKPYIKSNEDILGKEGLNNLLTKFPSVEKNFYKLWLASVDVLNNILNGQVVNQSKFLLDDIQEKIGVYVENKSFEEALTVIKSNNYVIISGSPGIGKTTLAEMLVFHLLSKGMEEFVFLSDSINDGYKFYNDNKRQIFLFDDFLGRNFLQNTLPTNEEKQILRFINKIQKSSNKVLIFTTREYILNQAKQKFDVFEKDLSKCVLDISKYSTLVKAKILYNHLSINEMPFEYVDEIIKQGYLLKIIKHTNYNPRIIESFTQRKLWEETKASEFPSKLINLFDAPFLVWEHVYENQISSISRIILNSILISGSKIEYDQLFKQVKVYIEQNKNSFDFTINNHNFKLSIRELENSLIQINKNHDGSLVIQYQNPSIQDFIVSYINKDKVAKKYLINSLHFLKPSLNIFSLKSDLFSNQKIILDKTLLEYLQEKLLDRFIKLEIDSKLPKYSKPSEDDNYIIKLFLIFDFFKSKSDTLKAFIQNKFENIIYSENITNRSIYEFSQLLILFYDTEKFDSERILLNISGCFWDYDDLGYLYEIKGLFEEEFENYEENGEDIIYEIVYDITYGITNTDTDEIEDLRNYIDQLKSIEEDFHYSLDNRIDELKTKIRRIEEKEFRQQDNFYDEFPDAYYPQRVSYIDGSLSNYISNQEEKESRSQSYEKPRDETEIINNLFKSLE
ncbi:nSTAND3 domain-containing NTPase [Tenacibaculum xiamenense]|uniref:nSTAND3 domain-containing NTPase n=1 Tax=Tenacibaculum xiamenense TaxID=1261553 RepID=UPI00389447CB